MKKIIFKKNRNNVVIINQNDQSTKLFDKKCEKLRIDTMKRSETKILFFQHFDQDFNLIFDNAQKVFDVIVKRLNYLTLIVDLAGVYVHEDFSHNSFNQETALKQYLINFDKHQDVLLQSDYFKNLSPYNKTM